MSLMLILTFDLTVYRHNECDQLSISLFFYRVSSVCRLPYPVLTKNYLISSSVLSSVICSLNLLNLFLYESSIFSWVKVEGRIVSSLKVRSVSTKTCKITANIARTMAA